MRNLHRYGFALLVLSAALLAFACCAAKRAPVVTVPHCTCVLGNDWPDHDAALAANYDVPEDCAVHGAETE